VTHGGYRVSALARLDETKEKRLMLLQACGLVDLPTDFVNG
jgi:hypothetical protein